MSIDGHDDRVPHNANDNAAYCSSQHVKGSKSVAHSSPSLYTIMNSMNTFNVYPRVVSFLLHHRITAPAYTRCPGITLIRRINHFCPCERLGISVAQQDDTRDSIIDGGAEQPNKLPHMG